MPPARSRTLDEGKNDNASHRERYAATISGNSARVKKSGAAQQAKESAPATASIEGSNTTALNWSNTRTSLLQTYRTAYALNTPASFHSSVAEAALTNPDGIGRFSPTMLKRNARRKRGTHEQLALAVRKHFNDLAVNETDVVIEFLYAVRSKDKALRHRFGPQKAK